MAPELAALLKDVLGPDYRVERELEGGGMSRVFLATDIRHDRAVVVKVLPPELVSAQSAQRFKREIEITARLQHPHILPVLTSGTWDDGAYFITPFISGESLRTRIAREKKLPLDDIVKILGDVGSAVAYAHARGIIHRDIKPGNILFAEGESILADFGIARIVSTEATPITTTGVILGTPMYMAPEMATHEAADVYSLGVVACEMLTGALPTRAMSAREIVTARGTVPGDSGWRLAALAALISRAVAPSLTTRTVSVKEMLTQLDAARHRWTRRHAGIAVGAMAAAGLAVFALSAARKNHGDLADAKYMVASVGAADSVTSDAVRSVAERMGDWRDVNVVDQAMDPNTAPSARTTTIQDALATSRRLGARNLIVVDAHTGSDTIAIEASIYDAASDTLVKKRRVAIPRSMSSASRIDASRTLVNGLVRDGEQLPWRSSLDHSHPSLAAWRAYDSGRAAIRQWDLRSAERAFRDALTLEGSLGIAHLWLAQTLAWANAPKRNEQSTEALSAETNGSSLTRRDSIVAEGLIALAARDSSDACAPFRRLLVRDTRDFAAWVGLGDCQAHDPLVLRDRRSSTGWVFRSSYEDAARAYRRAAVIGGSPGTGFQGWLLGRLSHVLVSATNLVRTGYAQSQRNVVMGSRPFLDHDTVAYAPYPMIGFRTLSGERDHKLLLLAANRNRTLLKRYAEEWVQTSPADGAAYDSLASLSQLTDGFGTVGGVAVPTRELLHRARRLLSDSTEQVRLAIAEVQELLKADSVVDARRKADSLIERNVMRRFPTVPGMLGFAALLGRIRETVWLLAQQPGSSQVMLTDGSPWSSPKPIADAAASLNIYAVFGAPLDSVRVLARRTVDLVRNYVPDSAQADSILSVLVAAPLSYVDPRESGVAKYRFQAPDEAARAVLFLASGDTVRARGQLAHADTLLRARTPGDGIGFPFRLATMSLALGERKSAMAKLDGIIATIPALNSAALDEVSTMALILRSFAMRANIARALNDTKTAQTDAAIVLVLLKGADPELDPIVNAMKSIQAIRP